MSSQVSLLSSISCCVSQLHLIIECPLVPKSEMTFPSSCSTSARLSSVRDSARLYQSPGGCDFLGRLYALYDAVGFSFCRGLHAIFESPTAPNLRRLESLLQAIPKHQWGVYVLVLTKLVNISEFMWDPVPLLRIPANTFVQNFKDTHCLNVSSYRVTTI